MFPFHLALLICTISNIANGYYYYNETTDNYTKGWCFDEAERNTLYYSDLTDKEIEDLPTFTLWQGGWASAYVTTILGYILLSEKVGINTDIFPHYDASKYWNYDLNYPQTLADWFENDDMELAFYMADQWTVPDIYVMIEEGAIAQTSNGVLFHSGYYIPDYLYSKKPESSLFTTWYDESFRNTTALQTENGNLTIYAPYSSWTGPKNSKYLAEYWNLSFVYNYTNSEPKFAAKLKSLYDAEVDFITFLYTPNFANVDITMETVKFPFNPSGTAHDPCRLENRCELADVYIQNMWQETEKLEQWPEVREFMMRYYIDRATVEEIMGLAYSGRYDTGEKHVWNAVCTWLRDETNAEQWQSWIPEIKREYCINGRCDTGNSTLQLTIFLLCGIVAISLIVFVAYKISKLCYEFQKQFVSTDGLKAVQRLKRDQKRKTIITLFQRIVTLVIGVADVITDGVSMIFIVFSISTQNYSSIFVWFYFAIWLIASIASAMHIFVTLKNIMEAVNEIKYGIDRRDQRRDSRLAKLLFQQNEIERKLKGTLSDIFVGVFEDIPFFILNVYSIFTVNKIELVIMFSTFVTTCNIGYKLSLIKQFFTNLQEKQAIKEQIGAAADDHEDDQQNSVVSAQLSAVSIVSVNQVGVNNKIIPAEISSSFE